MGLVQKKRLTQRMVSEHEGKPFRSPRVAPSWQPRRRTLDRAAATPSPPSPPLCRPQRRRRAKPATPVKGAVGI
jgi:hypothetical protein